jgi:hypothetical protein
VVKYEGFVTKELEVYLFSVWLVHELVMANLIKFLSLLIPLEVCSDHFLDWQTGGLNKDPNVWLDEASLPQSTFSKLVLVRQRN